MLVDRGNRFASRNAIPIAAAASTTPSVAGAENGTAPIRGASVLDELANALNSELLNNRRKYLNHRRPKSRYVDSLRRDMACGKVRPMRMILAVALADCEESDMPIGVVAGVFEKMANLLKAYAKEARQDQALGVTAPSLLPLMLRAQRAEAVENEHELRVMDAPDSIEAIDGLLAASAVERDAEDRRNADLMERRAKLTLEGK